MRVFHLFIALFICVVACHQRVVFSFEEDFLYFNDTDIEAFAWVPTLRARIRACKSYSCVEDILVPLNIPSFGHFQRMFSEELEHMKALAVQHTKQQFMQFFSTYYSAEELVAFRVWMMKIFGRYFFGQDMSDLNIPMTSDLMTFLLRIGHQRLHRKVAAVAKRDSGSFYKELPSYYSRMQSMLRSFVAIFSHTYRYLRLSFNEMMKLLPFLFHETRSVSQPMAKA